MIYYVYIFYNSAAIPLYVGYGKNLRWKDHFSMSTNIRLNRYLAKHTDCRVEFAAINQSLEDAKSLEKKLIKQYGRLDLNTGTLFNLTDGGDGTSGLLMTEEQKSKISQGAKRRWSNVSQREKHKEIMSKVTNSKEFKDKHARQKVMRDHQQQILKAEIDSRKKSERKVFFETIKYAFDQNDMQQIKNITGIKTESGLRRFLKRNGLIEK